jgi:hypothetical protein
MRRVVMQVAHDGCISVWKGSPSTSLVSIATNKVPRYSSCLSNSHLHLTCLHLVGHRRSASQQRQSSCVHSRSSERCPSCSFLSESNPKTPFSLNSKGGADVGAAMAADSRLPLISFTGSTAVGRFKQLAPHLHHHCLHPRTLTRSVCRSVGATVGKRLGRTILELGESASSSVAPKVLQ